METPAPDAFLAKMERLLGDEYDAFVASYDQPARIGLRVNPLKDSAIDFSKDAPFSLEPVGAYEPNGFLVTSAETDAVPRPGKHPYHAAGRYYLQEPAAMVVGALMHPQPGDWVLDLAAAPGGKSTHLASRMQNDGLLVANDVVGSRARILADNLARWGATRSLVLNDTPQRLADQFGALFDRVLLDAPCSGEGMFRKQGPFEWSESMVQACARRQSAILPDAARLVRPGGLLVYATCTFSPEEDEQVIAHFLQTHPDFAVEPAPAFAGFASGRPEWAGEGISAEICDQLAHTIRLWPHRFPGEGHFIALLRRTSDAPYQKRPAGFQPSSRSKGEIEVWRSFAQQALRWQPAAERLVVGGGRVYALPPDHIDTGSLKLVQYGLLLGEARKGHFRPSQALAWALHPEEVRSQLDFAPDDPMLARYMQGLDISAEADGWTLITVDGFGLGWGKGRLGRVKNHYPRYLRR